VKRRKQVGSSIGSLHLVFPSQRESSRAMTRTPRGCRACLSYSVFRPFFRAAWFFPAFARRRACGFFSFVSIFPCFFPPTSTLKKASLWISLFSALNFVSHSFRTSPPFSPSYLTRPSPFFEPSGRSLASANPLIDPTSRPSCSPVCSFTFCWNQLFVG